MVGGFALAFHGAPRFTGDLDLLVRPDPTNARKVLSALTAFGFGDLGLTVDDFMRRSDQPMRSSDLCPVTSTLRARWRSSSTGRVGARDRRTGPRARRRLRRRNSGAPAHERRLHPRVDHLHDLGFLAALEAEHLVLHGVVVRSRSVTVLNSALPPAMGSKAEPFMVMILPSADAVPRMAIMPVPMLSYQ